MCWNLKPAVIVVNLSWAHLLSVRCSQHSREQMLPLSLFVTSLQRTWNPMNTTVPAGDHFPNPQSHPWQVKKLWARFEKYARLSAGIFNLFSFNVLSVWVHGHNSALVNVTVFFYRNSSMLLHIMRVRVLLRAGLRHWAPMTLWHAKGSWGPSPSLLFPFFSGPSLSSPLPSLALPSPLPFPSLPSHHLPLLFPPLP